MVGLVELNFTALVKELGRKEIRGRERESCEVVFLAIAVAASKMGRLVCGGTTDIGAFVE